MRITRDSLLNLARDIAALRFRQEHDLVCIYLTGSLLHEEPLLGGAADIDLIFVHSKDPLEPREIQKINDDVSLDIAHLGQGIFEQPRHLRQDPWLGSFLCEDPLILQEHQHWFEFTQAAVCARFYAPEMVLARVKPLAEEARRLWFSLQSRPAIPQASDAKTYLKAVEKAVNALACLYGPPLTERRFLLDFSSVAEKENQPGFSAMANSLVGDPPPSADFWSAWLPAWKEALSEAGKHVGCPFNLLPARRAYYVKACEALRGDHPTAALWIMLRTWSKCEEVHPHPQVWKKFSAQADFDTAGFQIRMENLDQFLDVVDEWIEKWARFNGLQ